MKMIKAVREGRDSCSDLSWVFSLDRIGPRSGVVGGSTGESWVAVAVVVVVFVVVVGDDCVGVRRLSGFTLVVTPTEKLNKKIKIGKKWQGKISVIEKIVK